MSEILKVGAGEAPIRYNPAMFPTGGRENYTGMHDDIYVHTVIIEKEQKYAIVCFDLVVIPDDAKVKARAAELLEIAPENIILLNPHVLTTPHSILMGPPGQQFAEEQLAKQAMMDEANDNALKESVAAAKASVRPAKFGYAKGYTNFNVGRVVETAKGWSQQATCDEGDCDHDMPVFRFDDLDGNTIAIMYIVNCAAGMLENTHSDDGGRLVSGDIASASADFVRAEFPGAVAFYLCGATGDQWQAIRGIHGVIGRHGVYRERDLGDKGWLLLELMGERLGQQVVRAADSIVCHSVDEVRMSKYDLMIPGRKRFPGPPTVPHPIEKGDDVKVVVSLMSFDDVLWVGSSPEIQVGTIRAIREASPYAETAFSGWTNQGEGSSGTYMPEDYLYDRKTYQCNKSNFYMGAAEAFRDSVIELVKKSR